MKLIIAEKPSVANAITPVVGARSKRDGYYDGNGYIVSWCYGHLVGLLTPDDYNDNWAAKPWNFAQLPMIPNDWKFKISDGAKQQYNVLKKLLNDSNIDEVICATDADREGECIFRYVYNLSGSSKPVKRLWVSSLEESAISDGLKAVKPMSEYDNLYNAGFCRARADWLVGMNGSRLFSVRYHANLSCGRVQTPTLAMIVKRDDEVNNFVKQKYFKAQIDCGEFTADTERIDDEAKADEIVARCNGKSATVTEVTKTSKKENPPKLFDLTSLQREANKLFGFTAQQTLDLQQSLYEKKLSTYPRTDSEYITDDMQESTERLIAKLKGLDLPFVTEDIPHNVARCVNNKKVVSHPAILPTEKVTKEALNGISVLSVDEQKLLKLEIARLFVSTGQVHTYEAVKVNLMCEDVPFSASGRTVIDNGFKSTEKLFRDSLRVSNDDDNSDKKAQEKSLPDITKGQVFDGVAVVKTEHFTKPPKPYTEDTLLTAMEHAGDKEYEEGAEKKGLGTPATRAGTIEGLVKREYVKRKGKQLRATEKGINLIKVVPDEVKSAKLTADWETRLKAVERGESSADDFMSDITSFVSGLCTKYGQADNSVSFGNKKSSEALGKCPKCGADVKKGKYGFYCTGKCGMNVAKVYGKELTEAQVKKLLDGKEISFTSNSKKTVVKPEATEHEYNGKTYIQWRTGK